MSPCILWKTQSNQLILILALITLPGRLFEIIYGDCWDDVPLLLHDYAIQGLRRRIYIEAMLRCTPRICLPQLSELFQRMTLFQRELCLRRNDGYPWLDFFRILHHSRRVKDCFRRSGAKNGVDGEASRAKRDCPHSQLQLVLAPLSLDLAGLHNPLYYCYLLLYLDLHNCELCLEAT